MISPAWQRAAAAGLLSVLWCIGPAARADGGAEALQMQGEMALRSGQPDAALEAFERAAALQHSAETEVGIVRALMQRGDYRRALAFAGHTAFAHSESSDGTALYALLLRVGGQAAVAQRLLAQVRQRAPDDASLRRASHLLNAPAADADLAALGAIVVVGDTPPAHAAMVGNATLLPGGTHAVAPSSLLRATADLWLRNGLGRTVRAQIEQRDSDSGLTWLRLTEPIEPPAALALASREPFPGAPASVVAFDPQRGTQATWPQMSVGFLGTPALAGRWLGVDTGAGSVGAPVFDAAGRLTGVVMPAGDDQRLRFSGVTPLLAWGQPAAALPDNSAAARAGVDEVYERALRCTLQLITARAAP